MKNIKGLVLSGVLAVLFGVGCGGPVEDMGEGEPSTVQAEAGADAPGEVNALCDSGYYTCPSDGMIFEYDTPGCGFIYKPRAQSNCEAHCPVTCRDSGWMGY